MIKQWQYEVQQQHRSFSLPEGDPQELAGRLCGEQLTSSVLVSVFSTQHKLQPSGKRELQLRKHLYQIGL